MMHGQKNIKLFNESFMNCTKQILLRCRDQEQWGGQGMYYVFGREVYTRFW